MLTQWIWARTYSEKLSSGQVKMSSCSQSVNCPWRFCTKGTLLCILNMTRQEWCQWRLVKHCSLSRRYPHWSSQAPKSRKLSSSRNKRSLMKQMYGIQGPIWACLTRSSWRWSVASPGLFTKTPTRKKLHSMKRSPRYWGRCLIYSVIMRHPSELTASNSSRSK